VIYQRPTKRIPTSKIVIPMTKFPEIFKIYHVNITSGHFGIAKTLRINQYFWHPLLNRIMEDKIRSCDDCQTNKKPVSRCSCSWDWLLFDGEITNGYIKTSSKTKLRHKYILTAIDTCTRYLFAQALKRIRIKETIEFLKIIFNEKGIPWIIQTENGKNFVFTEFQDFLKL